MSSRISVVVGLMPLAASLFIVVLLVVGRVWIPGPEWVPDRTPPDGVLDSLIILDGASHVRRDAAAYGSWYVSYQMAETYPACNVISIVSARLESLGWEPLKKSLLNPAIPSSHVRGWSWYEDHTISPPLKVHRWSAQWKNSFGDVVWYSFTYRYPSQGKPNLESLAVSGTWYPADRVYLTQ